MEIDYVEMRDEEQMLDSGTDALFFDSGFFMKVKVLEIFQISNEVVGFSLLVCSSFFGSIFNMPRIEYFSFEDNQKMDFKVSGILERHTLDKRRLTFHHLDMHLIFGEEILSKFDKKALNLEDIILNQELV